MQHDEGEARRDAWAVIQGHRTARLARRHDVHVADEIDPSFAHVPHELFVARDDLRTVERDLEELGAKELEVSGRLAERLLRFSVPQSEHVPTVVTRLRSPANEPVPRVGPHHVLVGLPFVEGGPAGFPVAVDERIEPYDGGAGKGVRVAVLDTGYTPNVHPWLDAHTVAAPDMVEETDVHPQDGWLDDESGHGTFIAGVILERAPGVTIEVAKVLDSEGYGTELGVAHAILEYADADIINLSLGCYSHDDVPPLAIEEALRHLSPTTAVVAAAGNDSTHRLLWPAAHKRVVAVGALDDDMERAFFSNFGWWVDAAARGVHVLSTFLDFDESGHTGDIEGRTPQNFRGFARWSGTSFAAPKLAGEIAATMTRRGLDSAREAAAAVLATPGRPISAEVGVVFDI